MKIAVAGDHAGYGLKEHLKGILTQRGEEVEDFGPVSDTPSVDYPDYTKPVAEAVASGRCEGGVLVCGSGMGMAIAANRFKGVRAALCETPLMARLSRSHNDSNILCLGSRLTTPTVAEEILKAWLDTPFEGGRHMRRVEKIDMISELS
jgi:ribose 5-phosphate isomerase B